mgnify:CR=1 FL=1
MSDMNLSKHKTKLRKIGTGQGVLLSKPLVDLIGMNLGDKFTVRLIDNEIVLSPDNFRRG